MPQQERHEVALTATTSTQLLEGLRSRDNHTIWQQFVDRYQVVVFRWACRLGLDGDAAQEATQETMLAFCQAYLDGRYDRAKGGLRSWLFGIARNHISKLRGRPRHREVQVVDDAGRTAFFEKLGEDDHWDQAWEDEWRRAVLQQCLEEIRQTMAPKTVEAFELFAWKGWPASRVAEHLGMSENAVFLAKYKILHRIQDMVPRMEAIW